MLYERGGFNLKNKFAPVWARSDNSGFALGSGGAFLVIESRAHAEARGAKPFARLTMVEAIHQFAHEPSQVILGHPVRQRWWQQQQLVRFVRPEGLGHAPLSKPLPLRGRENVLTRTDS